MGAQDDDGSLEALQGLLGRCLVKVMGATPASGVLVAPGWVLTCAHAVANTQGPVTIAYNDVDYDVEVRAQAPRRAAENGMFRYPDMAIIRAGHLPDDHPCAWICDVPIQEEASLVAHGHASIYEPVRITRISGRCSGFSQGGSPEESFPMLAGNEIAPGMSGGPVLVRQQGRVGALVKTTRELNTDRGGLLTPIRGLWRLPGAEQLWRDHDRFHYTSRQWTELRGELGQRTGILTPSAEVNLFGLLAEIPTRPPAAGLPPAQSLRSEIQALARQPVQPGRLHPLLQRVLDLARVTADADARSGANVEVADQLWLWAAATAGELGQVPVFPSKPSRPAPQARRSERKALLLGSLTFPGVADSNPVSSLEQVLTDPDAGSFQAVSRPSGYGNRPDSADLVQDFIRSSGPSDMLLLYLGGCLTASADGRDVQLDVAGEPRGAGIQDLTGQAGLGRQSLAMASVADAARDLDDQSALIILVDYFRIADSPGDARAALQACWAGQPADSSPVFVLALERRHGSVNDLASFVADVLAGRRAQVGAQGDISVLDLANAVTASAPDAVAVLRNKLGKRNPRLAYQPLTYEARHIRDVLAPVQRALDQTGHLRLPPDIRFRYGLAASAARQVAERMAETIALWKQESTKNRYKTVARALLAEDDTHYKELLEAAQSGNQRRVDEILSRLGPLYGSMLDDGADSDPALEQAVLNRAGLWGFITREEEDYLAARYGPDELRRALRGHNFSVLPPPRLPQLPPVPAMPAFGEWLQSRGCRHVLDLLEDAPTLVSDHFFMGVEPGAISNEEADSAWRGVRAVLTEQLLSMPSQAWAAARAIQELDIAGLSDVARYQVAAQLRGRGGGAAELLIAARSLNLSDAAARCLGYALSREPELPDWVSRIAVLMADNQVCGALAAISAPEVPAHFANRESVLSVLARRRDAAAQALSQARAERDPDVAWRLLEEAEIGAGDFPGIAETRQMLPPAPSAWIRACAAPGADIVQISWAASPTAVGEITYDVWRQQGTRPPAAAAESGRQIERGTGVLEAQDRSAPNNVALWYSVVAVRSEARSAATVADTSAVQRPCVSGVWAEPGDGEVVLRWQLPREASAVTVKRLSDETAPRPVYAQLKSARDDGLANGTTYRYLLTAQYPGPGTDLMPSAAVVVTAVPQRPLPVLAAATLAAGEPHLLEVLGVPDGDDWVLLTSAEPLSHGAGTEVDVRSLPALGRELRPVRRDGHPPVIDAPGTDVVVTIVSIGGDRAMIGHSAPWGPVPEVEGLRTIRRGDRLEVFWHQTRDRKDLSFAVEQQSETGRPLSTTTFRPGMYERSWPLLLPARQESMQVTVTPMRSVTVGRESTVCSGNPTVAHVGARPRLRYFVRQANQGRWSRRPPYPAEVTLVLESQEPLTIAQLSITVQPGNVHPLEPRIESDGDLSRMLHQIPLVPGVPYPVILAEGRGSYRVRVFSPETDVELMHPPVSQRSVSWPT